MIHTVFEAFVVCYADQAYFYINNTLVSMNAVELSSTEKWPLILAEFTLHI